MKLLSSVKGALNDLYFDIIPLMVANILWVICSLPIITAVPALFALFYTANQLTHNNPGSWRTFFHGFRIYLWRSWYWGLANLIVIPLLIVNMTYYSNLQEVWVPWVQTLVVVAAVFWAALQIYSIPLLFEQEQFNFRLALRNSLVIWLRRPLYSLGVSLIVALLVLISTFIYPLLWLFVTAGLIAWLANKSTTHVIQVLKR